MSTPRRQGPPMLGRSGQSLTLDQALMHLEQLKETRGGNGPKPKLGIDITPSMMEAIEVDAESLGSPSSIAMDDLTSVSSEQEVAVQVFLRVRAHPQAPLGKVVNVQDGSQPRPCKRVEIGGRTFKFNAGGGEETSQDEVFACVGKSICDSVRRAARARSSTRHSAAVATQPRKSLVSRSPLLLPSRAVRSSCKATTARSSPTGRRARAKRTR